MFHDVLLLVHDVLWHFTMYQNVCKCFMMFNNVLRCLVSRATIGIAASATAVCLRDSDNATGINDNAAGQSGKVILPTDIDILHMSAHLHR